MDILEFYKSLLASLNIHDQDGTGLLSLDFDGTIMPLAIGGKRLALPTDQILSCPDDGLLVIFHPMAEAANTGESDVLKKLKDSIMLRCMRVVMGLINDLGQVAASHATHKKLGSKAARFLEGLGDFDETTLQALTDVCKQVSREPEKRLFSIFLKRAGTDDDIFIRKAVISFPIFDELNNDDKKTLLGVKMPRASTKFDKEMIAKLFTYVLGDEKTRNLFSYGSMDKDAPYLHSLLTSYYKFATHLNSLINVHRKHIESADELFIDLSWADGLDKFGIWRGVIPPQKGNKGVHLDKDGKPKASAPAASPRAGGLSSLVSRESAADSDDIPFDDPKPSTMPRDHDRQSSSSSEGITLAEIRRRQEEGRREESRFGRDDRYRDSRYSERRDYRDDHRRDYRDDRRGGGRGRGLGI